VLTLGLRGMSGLFIWNSIQVRWFTLLRCQFMFQGKRKDSFMLGKKFPYLPLSLELGILTQKFINL
jgi:hypothetical protein